jgi:DNA replication protein DnaC
MTIHSFAGTGKGEDGVETLKDKVNSSKRLKKQWRECQVLIIDEVSMVLSAEGK